MRKAIALLLLSFIILQTQAQDTRYGTFYGVHLYGYKSNLFNSDDLRVDSFQTYSITPGFGIQAEYGFLAENGFSISGGIQFGTNNQNYKGSHINVPYTMKASTKTSFLKIPLTMGIQAINDKKMKFLYTWGFYYSYLTAASDYMLIDYILPQTRDIETNIKNNEKTVQIIGDTAKARYSMDKRPYRRHGLGALASAGVTYRIGHKTDLLIQAKGEFQFTNMETTDEVVFTPTSNFTSPYTFLGHAFGNYAKWMDRQPANHNRAATRPFNLGISIGIRHYLWDFEK